MTDIQIAVPAANWCGEGPLWSAKDQALYWTDINRFLLQRYHPESASVRYWIFDEPVCATGLTDTPGLLVLALGSKLILWNEATDERTDFATPETNLPASRLNDGRPSPFGDFWIGSMQNNVNENGQGQPVSDPHLGTLYRVRNDASVTVQDRDLGISNTLCWSPDGTIFYFGDTLQNTIFAWDYDVATGEITNKRPFFSDFERGRPDGSAIDSDGYIWNARYGGSCIVRVAPDGSVDRVVDMPVSNLTSCTFGGPDLKTLYVTSAAQPGELHAGSVFSIAVDVAGHPENVFSLKG
ncbi:MAG: SMP-30/gluconolactonase/LRE family protein [Alphaproteobacteria bacterium]|nr:SMP-30/gluconolactonase/LRE family protein [Alphaproteobacteria bacterium]